MIRKMEAEIVKSVKAELLQMGSLTPKGPGLFFGLFLKFGQAIVDAIFVQKISNYW
jgi:hypothetical protein